MKCSLLKVAATKGDSLVLFECGGVHLKKGDVLAATPDIAARLKAQYKPCLADAGSCEKASLSGGHYEIMQPSAERAAPAAKPKAEPEPAKEKAVDAPPKNRSMRGRKKTKRK